ncbi:Alkaline-phosphatase-like, core domain [Pseudocohnilembus persalinus]|uniref:Alkaline-phosphatase-like, core domain n=1 Tax=Pseudocohnilembus persalinus TaxID=266149 RepID=A0A0V0QSP2_PSEPJ|nr:Alkaline-phosphatase-like, core domain [Pseudocohnilembus persalinus]|eukprot:KRX04952.1 Alkaline-phosphatase-like, core domain [Pseudocohnilembus persalinus]
MVDEEKVTQRTYDNYQIQDQNVVNVQNNRQSQNCNIPANISIQNGINNSVQTEMTNFQLQQTEQNFLLNNQNDQQENWSEIDYLNDTTLNCIDKFVSPNITYFWNELFKVVLPFYLIWLTIHLRINSYFSYIPLIYYANKIFRYYDPEPGFGKLKSTDIGVALQIAFVALLGISIGITTIIYAFLKTLHISYKKKKLLFFLELILVFALVMNVKRSYDNSCNGWEKGLTGSIDFSQDYCVIDKPQNNCINQFIDGWIDLSSKDMCDIQDVDKYREELINKWFYSDIKTNQNKLSMLQNNVVNAIAFPDMTKWTSRNRYPAYIQHRVIDKTVLLNSVEQGKKQNYEVILDLENMELNYNIQRNQKLVQQRKALQKDDSLSDNIVVIYIDTLSRPQAHRKMKKTLEYFDKFAFKPGMSQKQKQKIYDLGKRTFEFYRYHVVGQKTQPIVFRFIYGIKYIHKKHNPPKQKADHLFKYFQDNGYIVGLSTNTCTMNCLLRTSYMRPDVNHQTTADHEFQQIIYDPQYVNPKDYFSISQGPNAIQRRCLYGKDTFQHVLDYGYEFMNTYKNDKKVLYLEFTDAHEITDEVVGYADQPIRNFLDKLEAEGHLSKKTTVYLMSDHGQHLKKLFYVTDAIKNIYQQERSLPALFMLQTTDVFKEQPQIEKNLEENEQKLFGIEQLRTTMILNTDQISKSLGQESDHLFGDMKKNKHCHDLNLEKFTEDDNLCYCKEYKDEEPEFDEEEQQNILEQEQDSENKRNLR